MGEGDGAAKFLADREAQWWRDWWAADYSWDGLAAKPLYGWALDAEGSFVWTSDKRAVRAASLQDFWRDAPLVPETDRSGRVIRRWTFAHLPPQFENGSAAKASWDAATWAAMEQDLSSRIAMLAALSSSVQIDGVIAWAPEWLASVEVEYRSAAFLQSMHLTQDGRALTFRNCLFAGDLTVKDGRVDNFSLHGCVGHLLEFESRFGQLYVGAGSAFHTLVATGSGREIVVVDTSVVGDLRVLGGAIGSIVIHQAQAATMRIYNTGANLQIDGCQMGELLLDNIAAQCVSLDRSRVASTATFERLKVSALTATAVDFLECVTLVSTECDRMNFNQSRFESTADFQCRILSQASFEGCEFKRTAAFSMVEWPESLVTGVFRDAVFHKLADFGGQCPPSPAAFDGCSFKAGIRFHDDAYASDGLFRRFLAESRAQSAVTILENGCRGLKYAYESLRDRLSEQRFHRYELICRRHNPNTPASERFFSRLYGFAADYGGSLTRPLMNLFGLWLATAFVFAAWGATLALPVGAELLAESADLSGRNIFQPFGVWGRSPATGCNALESRFICSDAGSALRLAFRLVSTIQSLAAAILFFLAGLAIKRRFQMA